VHEASRKRALICGVSGQDGAYLAHLLLSKGYEVIGTSRDAQIASFSNLVSLDIRDKLALESMALNDFRSVLQVLSKAKPDEVYNLAGQTSVGLSFQMPVETMESISIGTLNFLEAIRFLGIPTKFYNACSSECFGNTYEPADENTPFHPRSPYAVAKSAAFWQVANYREAYGIHACSGILFNHDSPLRPERFVTKKIIAAACRIACGSNERLKLGDIRVCRDWGWAPEYAQAMWMIIQHEKPDDYVIATGESHTLEEFVSEAFSLLDLDWKQHVIIDDSLLRPSDILVSQGNPMKTRTQLRWEAQFKMKDVIRMMIKAEVSGEGIIHEHRA